LRAERGNAVSEELHRFRRSIFAATMSDCTETDRAAFARLLTRFVESQGVLVSAPDTWMAHVSYAGPDTRRPTHPPNSTGRPPKQLVPTR
jgi:hypothetical protein